MIYNVVKLSLFKVLLFFYGSRCIFWVFWTFAAKVFGIQSWIIYTAINIVTWRVFISLVWNYYKIWAALMHAWTINTEPYKGETLYLDLLHFLHPPQTLSRNKISLLQVAWSSMLQQVGWTGVYFFNKFFQLATQHCCVALKLKKNVAGITGF